MLLRWIAVYRVLREQNRMTARRTGGVRNGNSKAPIRPELTRPNQRWCRDNGCLMTFQKEGFIQFHRLPDEPSRKAKQ